MTILVINPGSTSTKMAAYSDGELIAEETIRHTSVEIDSFDGVISQSEFRKKFILAFIEKYELGKKLRAIVGRGGLLKPVTGGTYAINERMLVDLLSEKYGSHASNLGGILASEIATRYQIPSFIVDPVVVDELIEVARIAGLKGIERRSVAHVLNQKAVARKQLTEIGLDYRTSRIVVAHLGGGISIGAHRMGRLIDVTNGLDGEGPYSPERSGGLPLSEFAEYIINNSLTLAQAKKLISQEGGMKSFLGETDLKNITASIVTGSEDEAYFVNGMCYQISKAIGEMATVLKGKVDLIILTGGAAYSEYVVNQIKEGVSWIAPISVLAGEMEMEALYQGALRVLSGAEAVSIY